MTHKHNEDNIEGLIEKDFASGKWVATFHIDGRNFRSQIDFCPFCGERLR
jgi:hypothetical protein